MIVSPLMPIATPGEEFVVSSKSLWDTWEDCSFVYDREPA